MGLLTGVTAVGCVARKENPDAVERQESMDQEAFINMMNRLSVNLDTWETLKPSERETAVKAVINLFAEQRNVAIMKDAGHYLRRIRETLIANPEVRDMPLEQTMTVLAIMDYDYYNGQNKDELAREALGPEMFEVNKARLDAVNRGSTRPAD